MRRKFEILYSIHQGIKKLPGLESPLGRTLIYQAYSFYKSHFEDPYFKIFSAYPELLRGGHLLDVGANMGYHSEFFAKHVENPFSVFAFEPDPKHLEQLKWLKKSKKLDSLNLISSAVGATDSATQLWLNDENPADNRVWTKNFSKTISTEKIANEKIIPCDQMSLDSFWQTKLKGEKIAFIKIDVQGYESEVLQGAKKIIHELPHLALGLEICPELLSILGSSFDELKKFIHETQLNLYQFTGHQLNLIRPESLFKDFVPKGDLDYIDVIATKKKLAE